MLIFIWYIVLQANNNIYSATNNSNNNNTPNKSWTGPPRNQSPGNNTNISPVINNPNGKAFSICLY